MVVSPCNPLSVQSQRPHSALGTGPIVPAVLTLAILFAMPTSADKAGVLNNVPSDIAIAQILNNSRVFISHLLCASGSSAQARKELRLIHARVNLRQNVAAVKKCKKLRICDSPTLEGVSPPVSP